MSLDAAWRAALRWLGSWGVGRVCSGERELSESRDAAVPWRSCVSWPFLLDRADVIPAAGWPRDSEDEPEERDTGTARPGTVGEVRRPSPLGDPFAPVRLRGPPLVPSAGSVREGLEGESLILRLESLLGLAMLATPCAQRLSRPVPVKRPDAGRVFSEVCPLAADPPTLRPLMLGTVVDGVVRRGGTVVLTVVGMPKKMVALDFLRPLASRFSVESFQRPIRWRAAFACQREIRNIIACKTDCLQK